MTPQLAFSQHQHPRVLWVLLVRQESQGLQALTA
jgi:hypothetical protein